GARLAAAAVCQADAGGRARADEPRGAGGAAAARRLAGSAAAGETRARRAACIAVGAGARATRALSFRQARRRAAEAERLAAQFGRAAGGGGARCQADAGAGRRAADPAAGAAGAVAARWRAAAGVALAGVAAVGVGRADDIGLRRGAAGAGETRRSGGAALVGRAGKRGQIRRVLGACGEQRGDEQPANAHGNLPAMTTPDGTAATCTSE